jgi:hypothetical protein
LDVHVGQIFNHTTNTSISDPNNVLLLGTIVFIKDIGVLIFLRGVFIYLAILSLMRLFSRLLHCILMSVLAYVRRLNSFLYPCNRLMCIIMRGMIYKDQMMLILLILLMVLLSHFCRVQINILCLMMMILVVFWFWR